MNGEEPTDTEQSAGRVQRIAGLLVGPAFLALAAWFVWGSPGPNVPPAPTPAIDPAAIDPSPRRTPLSDPPIILIGGYEQRCDSCHMLFKSSWDRTRPLSQHTNIWLQHGLNTECDNCHARDNRERFVLHDKSEVDFTQVAMLCAQCHGTVYHDWTRGVHGKTLGYWNEKMGTRNRLTCTACHDPHQPAYDPIVPLPGPHTLRMGHPADTHDEPMVENRNPLRMWSQGGFDKGATDAKQGGDDPAEGQGQAPEPGGER